MSVPNTNYFLFVFFCVVFCLQDVTAPVTITSEAGKICTVLNPFLPSTYEFTAATYSNSASSATSTSSRPTETQHAKSKNLHIKEYRLRGQLQAQVQALGLCVRDSHGAESPAVPGPFANTYTWQTKGGETYTLHPGDCHSHQYDVL